MRKRQPHHSPIYDYSFEQTEKGAFLWIKDMDNGRSVTNHIEHVLTEIKEENHDKDLNNIKIMYCDTMGMWDQVKYQNGFAGFSPIQKTDFHEAKTVLLSL